MGAVGIVFGDIGTSPIYAFRETFAGHHPLAPDLLHVYGVLSLIFWSMMIIVTLKYVTIIMRADNKGEGGSLALLALINRTTAAARSRWTGGIVLLGVFATALFYGDSMITPAISVLSAVEGLTTVQASFQPFVIPVSIGILVGLFCDPVARHGAGRPDVRAGHARLFHRPSRCLACMHIVEHPAVILAMLNPLECGAFLLARAVARLHRHGLGRAGGDRRRGAVRRHGPFWPPADQGFVALFRAARHCCSTTWGRRRCSCR